MSTVLHPEIVDPTIGQGRWMVVIFDNDTNTIEEVMSVLVAATRCDMQEAYLETWEAHHFGQAAVHFASREECDEVAETIGAIGVRTEVRPEWGE
jgi:ATP-dependent Clp protease adaptor protein ClpS